MIARRAWTIPTPNSAKTVACRKVKGRVRSQVFQESVDSRPRSTRFTLARQQLHGEDGDPLAGHFGA
jgi:hypothetical protein